MKRSLATFGILACVASFMTSCKPKEEAAPVEAPAAVATDSAATASPPSAPDEKTGTQGFTPPRASCTEPAKFGHDCWTEKFPPDISHRSDIGCRFTITCCGEIVERWERAYPDAAGPSGVVSHATRDLTVLCGAPALADFDGDGIPNAADPNPASAEGLPWQ
jgi:hypothetical protein